MAKSKTPGIPNKHAFIRMSYLYQASAYLATLTPGEGGSNDAGKMGNRSQPTETILRPASTKHDVGPRLPLRNQARALLTDLRQISHKSQLRISPAVKQSMCKLCDTLLVDGQSCVSIVENKSKGGRKPWADILVRKCTTCGHERRFPVDASRQKRRAAREGERNAEGR